MTDEQAAARAAAGDELAMRALLDRYEGFVASLARFFFDQAADRDDLFQEARLAFFFAVRDYRPDAGATFKSFVSLVVRRHLIDYVKAARRPGRLALTTATRWVVDDGDEVEAVTLIAAAGAEPDERLAVRDDVRLIVRTVNERLSPLERECLLAFMNGETMRALQARLGHEFSTGSLDIVGRPRPKVVENAIGRAQRKVRQALAEAA